MAELMLEATENGSELELSVYKYPDEGFELYQDDDVVVIAPTQARKLVAFIMDNIGSNE